MSQRRTGSVDVKRSSRNSSQKASNNLLALDFGTSFSKACVRKGKEYIPLELGVSAGARRGGSAQPNPYVLASTIFVHNDQFLFGPTAYEASLTAPQGRRRFDSPKLLFNQEDLSLLDAAVDTDIVPGDIKFRQRDLILLYLGYFTAMTNDALGRLGIGGDIPRRYAVPGWAPLRATRYAKSLQDLLARAQLLAEVCRGQWTSGITTTNAREILDKIWHEKSPPTGLIREGMHEATAAGACVINRRWQKSRLFFIIDVGAGTTDLAAFVLFRPLANNTSVSDDARRFRLALIKGTSKGVDQAGNVLDETLLRLAIDKSLLNERQARTAEVTLRRQIRESKEAIFREPYYVDLKLDRRNVETVTKEELLQSHPILNMESSIREAFLAVINTVGSSALKKYEYDVDVYLTGGGAGLPFIGGLIEKQLIINGSALRMTRHQATPQWVQDSGADWLPYFSQLAVAIGAAQEDIPDEAGPYAEVGDPGKWRISGFRSYG